MHARRQILNSENSEFWKVIENTHTISDPSPDTPGGPKVSCEMRAFHSQSDLQIYRIFINRQLHFTLFDEAPRKWPFLVRDIGLGRGESWENLGVFQACPRMVRAIFLLLVWRTKVIIFSITETQIRYLATTAMIHRAAPLCGIQL